MLFLIVCMITIGDMDMLGKAARLTQPTEGIIGYCRLGSHAQHDIAKNWRCVIYRNRIFLLK